MATNTQNKILKIIIAGIGISLIIYYFVFPLIIKTMWKASHKDFKNVIIEGYVYDKKNKLLKNHTIYITNYFYGKSADESYQPYDLYTIMTDSNGYYSIKLNKSSYIQIDYTNVKEGPSSSFIEIYICKQKNKVDIHLK
jgi:hypothetical protein